MIHQLVDYARRAGLDAEPGFAPEAARWAVCCNAAGVYQGIVPLGAVEEKKSKGRMFAKCPRLTQPEMKAGGTGTRHFLLDAASVVAHWGKEADTPQAQAKHSCFARMLAEAAEVVPELSGPARCLASPGNVTALRHDLEQQKAAETDNVTFLVDGAFPIESENWHDWWREYRKRFAKTTKVKAGSEVRCFASGALVLPAATHEKIRGLSGVGGLSMGDVLVGFKQESFCSYGFEQSANAAMSSELAKAYQAGLNDLIARGHTLAGTRVTHWFRSKIQEEENPYAFLEGDNQELDARERARQLLTSLRSGQRPDLAGNTFYALTISGASGRVMVRDWMEGSFEELAAHIALWFDDLAIVAPDGRGWSRSPKFMAVLGATVRDLDELTAPFVARMWRVAVRGEPIPGPAHAQALSRFRAAILAGESPRVAGVSLLKAFHLRQNRQEERQMPELLQPELNPDHPSVAYQCGRMMAVLANLQERAQPAVKSGVVQRYFAAASTTPALVLGRLLRSAQVHRDKVAGDSPGLAAWYDRQLSDIATRIRHQPPTTLTLEEQSLFAIGYYQQLAFRQEKKVEGESND